MLSFCHSSPTSPVRLRQLLAQLTACGYKVCVVVVVFEFLMVVVETLVLLSLYHCFCCCLSFILGVSACCWFYIVGNRCAKREG